MENKIVRFGELYQIPSSNGLSRPSAVRGIGFKMINMGELFANNIISDIPMERVQMSESEQKKFFVEQGDLLFARQSLVAEGAGKCSIVKFFNEPTTFESHLIRVRLNQKVANPWYYYYLFQLKSNPIKAIINQCAQAGIRGSELVRVKVSNPPLPTQQKIASILSAYDNLIQNYKKQIEALQTAASELYKEWFVRFRFPGYQTTEFENGIPKGWKYLKLSELGYEVESGNRPAGGIDDSLEDGIPSLGAESIDKLGYFDYSNVKLVPREFYDNMKRGHGKDNDILLYKDGAYIGKVTLFRNDFPFKEYAVNEHVFLLRSNNKNYQNYLYFTLKMPQYFTQMQNLNRNAAQPGLARGDLDRIKILVSNERVIEKFNKFVNPMIDNIFSKSKQITNLTQQRDLLLPRLMSGKLGVKNNQFLV